MIVPQTFAAAHQLVLEIEKRLENAPTETDGMRCADYVGRIVVSKEQQKRGLALLNAIFFELEHRGKSINAGVRSSGKPEMVFDGADLVHFRLIELPKSLGERTWPSGKLKFKITELTTVGGRKCWMDDRHHKLEEHLDAICERIWGLAQKKKMKRLAREESCRKARERQRGRWRQRPQK